jgi:hypothetical protein
MSMAAGLALIVTMLLPAAASADGPFGLESFSGRTIDGADAPYTVAGGHPHANITEFSVPLRPGGTVPQDNLNGAYVTLPPGFIGNPATAPRCPVGHLGWSSEDISDCPPDSRIGFVEVTFNTNGTAANGTSSTRQTRPLYNIVPERGYPAQFAFMVVNATPTVLSVFPRPRTNSYGLTVATPNSPSVWVSFFQSTFCGNGVEGGGVLGPYACKPSSGAGRSPFLSNPVACSNIEPKWSIAIDSAEHAGALRESGGPDLSDPDWKTASFVDLPVTGCDAPALVAQFAPRIAVEPLQNSGPVQADQPSGLRVALEFPQSNDPTDPNTEFDSSLPQAPPPKDITVKLPAGLSINPSSADGLGACSDLASDPAGDQVHYDNTKPTQCPDSAKIGTATATSPLLATRDPVTDEVNGAEPIPGEVYLLKPHPGDLPIGGGNQEGKFRLLVELENPRYGINFKLPGTAIADKDTGQLTTVFTDNPQLPASDLTVDLKSGPRAPLATPVTCGAFQTTTDFVPWSTPGTPNAHPSASFGVGSGPGGSACAGSPGQRPFSPTMSAGSESSKAGANSPFVLRFTRADGEQEFSSLEATLPKGLAAKFVGIPYCSDAALAAAASRSGRAEQADPSCPASRIGSVSVGAGSGPNPFHTGGTAYLAGPYKGAPLSVAVITPAVAGPFDLGTVVVRNALYVNPETAQGRVVSDPFPKIIDGVPLRLRSIAVRLDRPGFMLNPTNCEPMSVAASIRSTDGASSSPTIPFQVGGCRALGFKPSLKLALKGGTKRSKHPALQATLTYPKGDYANIAKAVVTLPHSEFLAQNHIRTVCTRVQYAADACPKGSIYGFVKATTPLLDQPLEGPVYLRSSNNTLPDLVAALHGQIDIDLVGRIDSKNGGLRTTFDAVPDAPVSKFVLSMQGGKKGLLENSRNLCKTVNRAYVKFTGQNGMTLDSRPVLTNSCKKGKKGKGKGTHGKGKGAKKGKAKAQKRTVARLASLGF